MLPARKVPLSEEERKEIHEGKALLEKLVSDFKHDLESKATGYPEDTPIYRPPKKKDVLRAAKELLNPELLNPSESTGRVWETLKSHGH